MASQLQDGSGILCCQCGVLIEPNPMNMCLDCLKTHVDITEDIPRQGTLHFCSFCERYQVPPSLWIAAALESKELLNLCLSRLKGLNKVRLVDAGFVWTEPHSKRIKVKLVVQKSVFFGAELQQTFVVEFVVNHHMCEDCHRAEAQDFWSAIVQVRQKAEDSKLFFYLEQLILKHKMHETMLSMKPMNGGFDFFYANESVARKMVDFIVSVLPCRVQQSKKLTSHDIHSNIYNYKHTFSVELVPVSKDNLVCLSSTLAQQQGGISQLCLVYRINNMIHIIDPVTAQIAEISSTAYWRYPFNAICRSKDLVSYVVMDVENQDQKECNSFPGQGPVSKKHMVVDLWLVKASELGRTNDFIYARSHLGHILNHGDMVLGYAVLESNINDKHFGKMKEEKIPNVIVVKKCFEETREKSMKLKLQHLPSEYTNLNPESRDYQEFLNDIVEDPVYEEDIQIEGDISHANKKETPCSAEMDVDTEMS